MNDSEEVAANSPVSGSDLPIPVRRVSRVSDDDRVAMKVLSAQGMTAVDLSELFGFHPQTIRRQIAQVSGAELDAIRQVVSAELFALGRLTAKSYLIALLERDPNRLHLDRDGNTIEGSYVVTDADAIKVVEKATAGMAQVARGAGLDKDEGGGGSLLGNFMANEEALQRVVQGLPLGVKLKIDHSVTVESSDSPEGPSEAVEAPFSVEGESSEHGSSPSESGDPASSLF